jgi:3-oxoacyl-[acyl-carrier protein] reductase
MAEAFVSEGANVVCASRSEETLSAVVDEITEGESGRAIAIPTNVHSWEEVRAMVEKTVEEFGRLDVIVNNAGVTQLNMNEEPEYLPVAEMPIEVWDGILDTNLRGVFLCTKAALGKLLPQDSGRLIHISPGHGV